MEKQTQAPIVKLNTPTAQRSVLRMVVGTLKDKPDMLPHFPILFELAGCDVTLSGHGDGPTVGHPGLEEQKVLDWLGEVTK